MRSLRGLADCEVGPSRLSRFMRSKVEAQPGVEPGYETVPRLRVTIPPPCPKLLITRTGAPALITTCRMVIASGTWTAGAPITLKLMSSLRRALSGRGWPTGCSRRLGLACVLHDFSCMFMWHRLRSGPQLGLLFHLSGSLQGDALSRKFLTKGAGGLAPITATTPTPPLMRRSMRPARRGKAITSYVRWTDHAFGKITTTHCKSTLNAKHSHHASSNFRR